jgi:hypothetical protein
MAAERIREIFKGADGNGSAPLIADSATPGMGLDRHAMAQWDYN